MCYYCICICKRKGKKERRNGEWEVVVSVRACVCVSYIAICVVYLWVIHAIASLFEAEWNVWFFLSFVRQKEGFEFLFRKGEKGNNLG